MGQVEQKPLSPEAMEALKRGIDFLAEIIAQDILEKRSKGIPIVQDEDSPNEGMSESGNS